MMDSFKQQHGDQEEVKQLDENEQFGRVFSDQQHNVPSSLCRTRTWFLSAAMTLPAPSSSWAATTDPSTI